VLGVAVIGAGFGIAIGLRSHAVDHHPTVRLFGATAEVTVTPEETPRALSNGRLMFRAALVAIADDDSTLTAPYCTSHRLRRRLSCLVDQ
jgi:competence protein ComEC